MRRRTYLTGVGTGVAVFSGLSFAGLRAGRAESGAEYRDADPGYRDGTPVVYERDDLELSLIQETVRLGDQVEFRVSNTGDSEIAFACHSPWALQRFLDAEWRHVTWISDRDSLLCATILPPGESLEERISLSEAELEEHGDEVHAELSPGTYRFLLVGTTPYLATDFTVRDSG